MHPMIGFDETMNTMHSVRALRQVDLNLFVAFDALVQERSVTKAAARVGVTQPAMSHTLNRLRDLFDDPLLVRGRGGMMLTPRAEALALPLRSGLLSLQRALDEPAAFDPKRSRRLFRIVSPDLFDVLALPTLLHRIGKRAPHVDVAVLPTWSQLHDQLETGDVDLAILPVLVGADSVDEAGAMPHDLMRRVLFHDRLCCFVRRGHPAVDGRGRLSLRAYTSLSHVLVSPGGGGPGVVDEALAARGLQRRVAVRVPQFSSALAILPKSDLMLTGPWSLGAVASAKPLVRLRAPLALPQHAITMVWHPRFSEEPGHRWLRELLVEVTASVAPPGGASSR